MAEDASTQSDSSPKKLTKSARAKAWQDQLDRAQVVRVPGVRSMLLALVVLAVVFSLHLLAPMVVPVVAALLLSFLFKPMVRACKRWKVPPPITALIALVVLIGVLLLPVVAAFYTAMAWVDDLPAAVEALPVKFPAFTKPTQFLRNSQLLDALPEVLGIGQSLVFAIGITLVLTFFFLASGDLLTRRIVKLISSLSAQKEAVKAIQQIESDVSTYLVTLTLINICVGLATWGLMALLGVPDAWTLGVVAGVFNFVPYVGAVAALVVIGFAGLVHAPDGQPGLAIWPPLAFLLVNSIEAYVVGPMIYGHRLRVNAMMILLAIVFFGWMWGIAGAVMAVPLLVSFKIVCSHVPGLEPVAFLLDGSPLPAEKQQDQTLPESDCADDTAVEQAVQQINQPDEPPPAASPRPA
jgi:predicted PurR-regulated permease PerM